MQKSSRSVKACGRNRETNGHIDKYRKIDYAVPNSRPETVRLKILASFVLLKLGESISISNTVPLSTRVLFSILLSIPKYCIDKIVFEEILEKAYST